MKIDQNLARTEQLKKSLETDNNLLKEKESEILENAKNKAREILLNAKEDANDIIRELEKSPSAKKSNKLRKNLNDKIDKLSTSKVEPKHISLEKKDIKIGLNVDIPSIHQSGTIISNITKNDTVQVQIGIIKTYFNITDLTLSKEPIKKEISVNTKKRDFKVSSISPEINVIGQNVDEACFVVDKYLDNCVLNGLTTVRIVHGKGTGILKKGIQNFLKNHPHVKSYRIGTFGEGENGVTIVELK